MARTLDELKAEVLSLPLGERLDLARELVASAGDSDVDAAWLAEIQRRVALADAGQAGDIDADVLYNQLRARYQWDESATPRSRR